MSIFVDETTKVVIQGISPTSQGLFHGLRNKAYGTKVVGGTNPKRGGEEIEGIPVYASVAEAVKDSGATASFISVPPRGAADARRRWSLWGPCASPRFGATADAPRSRRSLIRSPSTAAYVWAAQTSPSASATPMIVFG